MYNPKYHQALSFQIQGTCPLPPFPLRSVPWWLVHTNKSIPQGAFHFKVEIVHWGETASQSAIVRFKAFPFPISLVLKPLSSILLT